MKVDPLHVRSCGQEAIQEALVRYYQIKGIKFKKEPITREEISQEIRGGGSPLRCLISFFSEEGRSITWPSEVIEFFENHIELQKPGHYSGGRVDSQIKNSTDIRIEPAELDRPGYSVFKQYFDALHKCYHDYCSQWEFFNSFISKVHIGSFNLQKYEPGGHYAELHSERTSLADAHRILVWMTYLNDIKDSGETEFPHYNLKVTPRTGTTLIWPAEWTHAHRGNPTLMETKFIITGWFHLAA